MRTVVVAVGHCADNTHAVTYFEHAKQFAVGIETEVNHKAEINTALRIVVFDVASLRFTISDNAFDSNFFVDVFCQVGTKCFQRDGDGIAVEEIGILFIAVHIQFCGARVVDCTFAIGGVTIVVSVLRYSHTVFQQLDVEVAILAVGSSFVPNPHHYAATRAVLVPSVGVRLYNDFVGVGKAFLVELAGKLSPRFDCTCAFGGVGCHVSCFKYAVFLFKHAVIGKRRRHGKVRRIAVDKTDLFAAHFTNLGIGKTFDGCV